MRPPSGTPASQVPATPALYHADADLHQSINQTIIHPIHIHPQTIKDFLQTQPINNNVSP